MSSLLSSSSSGSSSSSSSGSRKNHRLNNNNRISKTSNSNSHNSSSSSSSNSSNQNIWLMLAGCIIFVFVTSYHNFKDGSNFDYKDSALSSFGVPRHDESQSQSQSQSQPLLQLQLSELTRSHIQNIICPEPLVPVYDRIIHDYNNNNNNNNSNNSSEQEQEQLIPKFIHLSMKTRCISKDMMDIVDIWKNQFPSYNVYFHDDSAVDALFYDSGHYWSDIFPQLQQLMTSCVKYGSAMKIDIWRVLILYRYGGIYSDIDNAPGPKLTELTIEKNASAFFLSDGWDRPSHWLHGMAPNHPISFHTMLVIFENLLKLTNVSKVRLVHVTGPEALRQGYTTAISTGENDRGEEPFKQIFNLGIHKVRKPYQEKLVYKFAYRDYVYQNNNEKVPYSSIMNSNGNDNSNTTTTTTTTTMITKKERIQIEMNISHWTKIVYKAVDIPTGMCIDYIYENALKHQLERKYAK